MKVGPTSVVRTSGRGDSALRHGWLNVTWFYRFLQTVIQTFGPLRSGLALHLFICWLFPIDLNTVDLRHLSSGLTVQVNRTSPVFYALLDTLEDGQTEDEGSPNLSPVVLSLEEKSDYSKWAKRIITQNKKIMNNMGNQEMNTHIILPQFVVTRPGKNPVGSPVLLGEAQPNKAQPREDLSTHDVSNSLAYLERARRQKEEERVKETLAERPHLAAHLNRPGVLETLTEVGEELGKQESLSARIDEVLKREFTQSPARGESVTDGKPLESFAALDGRPELKRNLPSLTPWYNADKVGAKSSTAQPLPLRPDAFGALSAVSRSQPQVEKTAMAERENKELVTIPNVGSARLEGVADGFAVDGGGTSSGEADNGLFIEGYIEFAGGLAFMGPSQRLVVYREHEGRVHEEGHVWVREASFKISVSERRGRLVVELLNENGVIVGRGVHDLSTKLISAHGEPRATITLKPVIWGVAGEVISAYSFEHHVRPIQGAELAIEGIGLVAKTDEKGAFVSDDVAQSSSYILQASAPEHWSTVTLSGAGEIKTVRLYPEKMISALGATLRAQGLEVPLERGDSLIWGTVSRQGQPLAGATVEISGPSAGRVIYFNDYMIADTKLSSTSRSAAFVIIGIEEGLYSVRARLADKISAMAIAPVRRGAVSSTDLNINEAKQVAVTSFDAFDTQRPIVTTVAELGTEHLLTLSESGVGNFPTSQGEGFAIFENDAPVPYIRTRQVVPRRQTHLHLPQIDERWLQSLQQVSRINFLPQTGQAIGFVPDSDFSVYIDGLPMSQENGIYFDAAGNPTGERSGPQGGGVFLFNLTPGFHVISVTRPQSDQIFLQLVVSEPGFLQTFHAY